MFKVKQYDLDSRHIDLVAVLAPERTSDEKFLGMGSSNGKIEYENNRWSELEQEMKDKYNKERSIQRTKTKVRRLCISQNMAYMWTLTFREKYVMVKGKPKDMGDLDSAWSMWTAFIKRCKRAGLNFDYIVTAEVQEKRLKKFGEKLYHFHFVTNKLLPVNEEIQKELKRSHNIEDLWGHGYVFVSVRKKTQKSLVARYITKYITKMFDECEKSSNRYRCSQGMVVPCQQKFFKSELEIDMYMAKLASEKNLELRKEYYPLNNGDIEVLVYLLAPKYYKNKKKRGNLNVNSKDGIKSCG